MDHLEAAKALINGATTKAFLAAVALLTLWLSAIEPQRGQAEALFQIQRRMAFDSATHKALLEVRPLPWRTAKGPASGISDAQRQKWEARRTQFQDSIRAIAKSGDSVTFSVVPYEVFGLHFAVPGQLAAIAWLGLCVGGVVVLYNLRKRALAFLATGIRRLKAAGDLPSTPPQQLVASPPWWLSPLPRRDGTGVTPHEMAAALAWTKPGHLMRWAAVAGTLLLCILIASRVFWIGVVATGALRSQPLISACAGALLAGLVLLAGRWAIPDSVPDVFDADPASTVTPRRTFVVALATVLLGGIPGYALHTHANANQRRIRELSPRHRSKRRPTLVTKTAVPLPSGFYATPRRKVYYVTRAQELVHRGSPPVVANLRQIEYGPAGFLFSSKPLPRMNWGCRALSFEVAADEALDHKEPARACDVLIVGIIDAPPNARDVERLASRCRRIGRRHGLRTHLDRLQKALDRTRGLGA